MFSINRRGNGVQRPLERLAALLAIVAGAWWTVGGGEPSADSAAWMGAETASRDGRRGRDVAPAFTPQPTLDELCREHAQVVALRGGDELSVVAEAPFVVAGDLQRDELRQWLDDTIQPFARAISRAYFASRPDRPIVVMAFSSEQAYRSCALRLFGDVRISRFGYFKPDRGTVLVNIGDGPAPLFHELTHALMAFDFPAAPAWLAEGMAVMHESAEINKRGELLIIGGLAGWRARILNETPQTDDRAALAKLLEREALSGDDEAFAYALAGRLCLLLEQEGLLDDVYRALREGATRETDVLRLLRGEACAWGQSPRAK